MSAAETAFVFECEGAELPAVLHHGEDAAAQGVLIVVGGPQTRVGSHRQFVLLARDLAAAGIPVMRFDYRGMGDAGGPFVGFEGIGPDIRAAIDAFQAQCAHVTHVVLWGLCDAATAAAFYAPGDTRVSGLVLLNPWVRTEEGQAEAYLQHYYRRRLMQWDFWRKTLGGGLRPVRSLRALVGNWRAARSGRETEESLPARLAASVERCTVPILFVLSGNDLTAQEFQHSMQGQPGWERIRQRETVDIVEIADANHTFSRARWRDAVAQSTRTWLRG